MKKLIVMLMAMIVAISCNNPSGSNQATNNSESKTAVVSSQPDKPDQPETPEAVEPINGSGDADSGKPGKLKTSKSTPSSNLRVGVGEENSADPEEPSKPTQPKAPAKPAVHTTEPAPDKIPGNDLPGDALRPFAQLARQNEKPAYLVHVIAGMDNTITCPEGTEITLPANALETESGKPVTGDVSVRVREYYKMSDILMANLTTTSNGELLVTGGMIHIEAWSQGEKCRLKEGKTIEVAFPAPDERADDMQLFNGEWIDGQINWTVQETEPDTQEEQVFTVVDRMPQFPGGNQKRLEYLRENLVYPDVAKQAGIQGTVYVSFIVEENGELTDIQILRGLDSSINREVLRVVRGMPRWIPGEQSGKPVRTQFYMPFRFTLGDDFQSFDAKSFENSTSDSTLTDKEVSEVSGYIFSSSNLGWINCDRFYKIRRPKFDYIVDIGSSVKSDIKMVFKDFRGVISGWPQKGVFTFNQIPSGLNVTIVALKQDADGYQLAMKKTVTSKKMESLHFEPVTMAGLKEAMKQLD